MKTNALSMVHIVITDDNSAGVSLHVTERQCELAFERWEEVRKNGAMDAEYTDGYVLNMIRNEILSCQLWIHRICDARCWPEPEIVNRAAPAEMDRDFMLFGKSKIAAACWLQQQIEASPVYRIFREAKHNLTEMGMEKLAPFQKVVEHIARAAKDSDAMQFQKAELSGLLSLEGELPDSAGIFLSKMEICVDALTDDDYEAQQTLYCTEG